MTQVVKRCRRILRRTWREYGDDQVSIVASGVAFRVVLAVFPGIALLVRVGTRTLGPGDAQRLLQAATGVFPDAGRSVLVQAVRSSIRDDPADNAAQAGVLGAAAPILGLLFTLWSTNSGMKALFNALNVIFDIAERRSFLHFTAVTLLFTAGTLIAILFTMMLVVASPVIVAAAGMSEPHGSALTLLRWPVLFVVAAVALSILYRYAPHRDQGSWPLVTVGGT